MDQHEFASQRFSGADGWKLRILIVEDSPLAARQLAEFLRLQGYEVDLAVDGPTALEKIRSGQPDALLLDIGLPGMDGWQVVEELRRQVAPKRPLIIAVTGRGTEADRLRSHRAGIDLHLSKPVDGEELSWILSRFQKVLAPE